MSDVRRRSLQELHALPPPGEPSDSRLDIDINEGLTPTLSDIRIPGFQNLESQQTETLSRLKRFDDVDLATSLSILEQGQQFGWGTMTQGLRAHPDVRRIYRDAAYIAALTDRPDDEIPYIARNIDRYSQELFDRPYTPDLGDKLRASITAGRLQVEKSFIYDRAYLEGRPLNNDELRRLAQLDGQMPLPSELETNFWEKLVVTLPGQVPKIISHFYEGATKYALPIGIGVMLGWIAMGLSSGGTGFLTGAGLTGLAGTGKTTAGTLGLLGAKTGAGLQTMNSLAIQSMIGSIGGAQMVGQSASSMRMYRSIAIEDLRSLRDNEGRGLSTDEIYFFATIHGVVASLAETVAIKSGLGLIPGFRDLLGAGATQSLIKGGTRQILQHHLSKYGANIGVQGTTELAQALSQNLIREAAIAQYNRDNSDEVQQLLGLMEYELNQLVMSNLPVTDEFLKRWDEKFDVIREGAQRIEHQWERVMPDLIESTTAGIAMGITGGAAATLMSVSQDLNTAARGRVAKSQGNVYADVYDAAHGATPADLNMAAINRLTEVFEGVKDKLTERQLGILEALITRPDIMSEADIATAQQLAGQKDLSLADIQARIDGTDAMAAQEGTFGTFVDGQPFFEEMVRPDTITEKTHNELAARLRKQLDDRENMQATHGQYSLDSFNQAAALRKAADSRWRDDFQIVTAPKLDPRQSVEAARQMRSDFGSRLAQVDNQALVADIVARERVRLSLLPPQAKMRTDVMATIHDMLLYDDAGRLIQNTVKPDTYVRPVLMSNLAEVGLSLPGYYRASSLQIAQQFNMPLAAAETVSQTLQDTARQHPGTGVEVSESFVNYDRLRARLAEAATHERDPVTVHFKYEDFTDFASRRYNMMTEKQILEAYNESFGNFLTLYEEFADKPNVKFYAEKEHRAPGDRRVIYRALDKRMKNLADKAGIKRKAKWTKEMVNEWLDNHRRLILDSEIVAGQELQDLTLERYGLKRDDNNHYRMNEPVTQQYFDENRNMIEGLAEHHEHLSQSRLRQQAIEGVTQEQWTVEFASAFEEMFWNYFRRDQGQELIANQIAYAENQALVDAINRIHPEKRTKAQTDKLRSQYNMAMAVYVEIQQALEDGTFDEQFSKHVLRKVAKSERGSEKLEIIAMAKNLNTEMVEIAQRISEHYKQQFVEAQKHNVIHEALQNYTMHRWLFDKNYVKEHAHDVFRTETASALARQVDTIIDGWAQGKEFAFEGLLDSYQAYHQQLQAAIAARRMVDAGLQMKNLDGSGIFELNNNRRTEYRSVNLNQLYKLVESQEYTAQDIVDGKVEGNYTLIHGKAYLRSPVFAHPDVALMLEHALGEAKFTGAITSRVMSGLMKWSQFRKATKLVSNLFHPFSYMRSYYFPASGMKYGTRFSPIRATREGLNILRASKDATAEHIEILRLAVEEGFTVNMRQDFHKIIGDKETWLGQVADKYKPSPNARNKLMRMVTSLHHFTFDILGPGLKTSAFMVEFREHMHHNPTADSRDVARRIALLVNDDFGGLNLKREARNPTNQALFRTFIMAPDWTESNVRTMLRMFDGRVDEQTRKQYQRFWLRALTRVFVGTQVGNIMIASIFSDEGIGEILENYKAIFGAVGDVKDWQYTRRLILNALNMDITPLWRAINNSRWNQERAREGKIQIASLDPNERKYWRFIGHFGDLFKFVGFATESVIGKSAMGVLDLMAAATGRAWNDQEFRTFADLFDDVDSFGAVFNPLTYTRFGLGRPGPVSLITGSAYAWMLYTIMQSFPQQFDRMVAANQGREDALTAIFNGLGLGLSSMRPWSPSRARSGRITAPGSSRVRPPGR